MTPCEIIKSISSIAGEIETNRTETLQRTTVAKVSLIRLIRDYNGVAYDTGKCSITAVLFNDIFNGTIFFNHLRNSAN